MQDTGISWTQKTWNPWSGCTKVSPGCAFCYAERIAEPKRGSPAFPNGFDLTLRLYKLNEPKKLKEPSIIFVNSMSDFFWDQVTDAARDHACGIMEETPQHRYQVLTKREDELLRYSRRRRLPRNFWAGVSVESADYTYRIDVLRQVDAAVRFLSIEPLLGPIPNLDLTGIHWVIVGGESGDHFSDPKIRAKRFLVDQVGRDYRPRPERIPWVRSIRDACAAAGVPFFFKQWGGRRDKSGGWELDGCTHHAMPDGSTME